MHQEDFNDVISSQREINGLRSDVARLTTEVQHWRRMASDLQVRQLQMIALLPVCSVRNLSFFVSHTETIPAEECQIPDVGLCVLISLLGHIVLYSSNGGYISLMTHQDADLHHILLLNSFLVSTTQSSLAA